MAGDPHKPFSEPDYITDPRHYGIPLPETDVALSVEEFDRRYRQKIKAFLNRDDAIKFAYHCNLDTLTCPVYDSVEDQWVYNADETGRLAAEIN